MKNKLYYYYIRVRHYFGLKPRKLSDAMELGYEEAIKYGAQQGLFSTYHYKDGVPTFCALGFAGVALYGYDEMTKGDMMTEVGFSGTHILRELGVDERAKAPELMLQLRKTNTYGESICGVIFDLNDNDRRSMPEIISAVRSCEL